MRLPMSFVAVLLFASITSSQIVDPKEQPKKASSIVPAALKAVGGQLVVIDAKSAKGDVSFRWDKVVFENRATVDGKKLFLSIPEYDDERTYSVEMISWDDRLTETTNIVVQGKKIPIPVPPEPNPSDLSKRLDKIDASIASIETRLIYLEKIKPNPPPEPKPGPSVIDPPLDVVVIWESADSSPVIAKVLKDLYFWKSLEPIGVRWFQYDKDSTVGSQKVVDMYGYRTYMEKTGLPCIMYMDKSGHVLRADKLPESTDKIRSVVKEYLGK
jgi:hypothetical protein